MSKPHQRPRVYLLVPIWPHLNPGEIFGPIPGERKRAAQRGLYLEVTKIEVCPEKTQNLEFFIKDETRIKSTHWPSMADTEFLTRSPMSHPPSRNLDFSMGGGCDWLGPATPERSKSLPGRSENFE
ncbi:hypothetical protein ONZ45_g17344 [Pleurotus djamor]|nr:hypothetical protein ONZ45_g17344 [Pleurotus djamor]